MTGDTAIVHSLRQADVVHTDSVAATFERAASHTVTLAPDVEIQIGLAHAFDFDGVSPPEDLKLTSAFEKAALENTIGAPAAVVPAVLRYTVDNNPAPHVEPM
ncbi:MAG: hypothetical protein ACLFP8_01735 [Alphaproteobacteria bacterium]